MKVSLIISVYKDTKNLKVILDALETQTEKNFEVIISEDGDSDEIKLFISNCNYSFKIIHSFQEDLGWRKNRALNKAIKLVTSDWVIFTDGDCVPHYKFIESHLLFAEKNIILSGRRVNLGEKYSKLIQNNLLRPKDLDKSYNLKLLNLYIDKESSFIEEGIYIAPESIVARYLYKRKRNTSLLGCNFSCSKYAIKIVNGFDEDYVSPGIGEDVDIEWRFKKAGFKFLSLKNLAIQYHLHHKRGYAVTRRELLDEKTRQGLSYCENGLEKRGD